MVRDIRPAASRENGCDVIQLISTVLDQQDAVSFEDRPTIGGKRTYGVQPVFARDQRVDRFVPQVDEHFVAGSHIGRV